MKTLSPTESIAPRYTVSQSAEAATVKVELPGVEKDNIQLSIKDQTLHLRAQRQHAPTENLRWLHRELRTEDFALSLRISARLDASNVQARHENGVLTLTLPVVAAAQSRTIAIN